MTRQVATSVENNFRNALVTEASGLNFPENACTETYDCVFNADGSVVRRPGIDYEFGSSTKTIDRDNSVVSTYMWKNVAGNGDLTLLVVQVGATLYFYKTNVSGGLSQGAVATTVNLATYSATGAPTPELNECQFSDGNGLLFVTHPYCETFYVSYATSTDTATATEVTLKIRDLEGVEDGLAVDNRPTTTLAAMDDDHEYNLRNQGWNTTNLTAWDTARSDMPSNADVMWYFKNSSDAFDTATVANVMIGNSPAPNGHFILDLHDQDRDAAAGTSGVPGTDTSYYRCSTSAFFAGRVFYSGINYVGFNSKIYFTQIVEKVAQYGYCYQANDPTAEDVFDLLPSDGGVISIPEAGTIYKLVAIAGGLIVFAANGVWIVSGSTGIGFTATDYSVNKISSIGTLTATSFVDVAGFPAWWNAEGIYILTAGEGGPAIQSLSDAKIKRFYDTIPPLSKTQARGFFNSVEGVIQWLFRSEGSDVPTEIYEYDRILNFNVMTGAFYPWRITDSTVTVNGLLVMDSTVGTIDVNTVIRGADTIVDASGNTVITYASTTSGNESPRFKYLVSASNGAGSYNFTFAEFNNFDYIDWFQYDSVGEDFESYFISGYKIHGEALRKFQANYVTLISRLDTAVEYYFQGIWDYAANSDTGRWSVQQTISHTNLNYSNAFRRLKVRGHGKALQFKVTSSTGQAFDILGWATFETGNALP
jgi:hypothetical protein